jgi:hypothetical protein
MQKGYRYSQIDPVKYVRKRFRVDNFHFFMRIIIETFKIMLFILMSPLN